MGIVDDEQLLAVGLDAGTRGVRALAIDLTGRVVATGRADFPAHSQRSEGVLAEQDPRAWTTAAQTALQSTTAALPAGSKIIGVGVDATSGTFLLADAQNRPLGPAIMYNDLRATAQAPRAAEALRARSGRTALRSPPPSRCPKSCTWPPRNRSSLAGAGASSTRQIGSSACSVGGTT